MPYFQRFHFVDNFVDKLKLFNIHRTRGELGGQTIVNSVEKYSFFTTKTVKMSSNISDTIIFIMKFYYENQRNFYDVFLIF